MLNHVYSIKNNLAERFNDVFSSATDALAINSVQEVFKEHPDKMSNISLYRVGSVDIETGVVTALANPVELVLGMPSAVPIDNMVK